MASDTPSRLDPLPPGARDLLEGAAWRRRRITGQLLDTFRRWGYCEVVVPSLEYDEVHGRGLGEAVRRRSVRFVEGASGKLVTLRADVTPQIARLVAQRLAPRRGGEGAELFRVCYAADVVRLPEHSRDRSEVHQVGVELVGDAEPLADAEIVCLVHAALTQAGLGGFRIELAHRAVLEDAARTLGIDPGLLRRGPEPGGGSGGLAGYLARKDPEGLEQALTRLSVAPRARRAFVALVSAFGPPHEVLEAAGRKLAPLGVRGALARIAEVVAQVEALDPEAAGALALDLGEVRGFDYYTGLRLRVWAPGVAEPLVRGGRYNDMMSRYGLDAAATGFAIDLDALERALLVGREGSSEEDALPGAGGQLFALPADAAPARRLEAARAAAAARALGPAWVEPRSSLDAAREAATRVGAHRLTWFGERKVSYERVEGHWRRCAATRVLDPSNNRRRRAAPEGKKKR